MPTAAEARKLWGEMKAKAKRMGGGEDAKNVDASDFTPAEPLHTYEKTGKKPIGKQSYVGEPIKLGGPFKRGGKVVGPVHGDMPGANVTKMSRHPTHKCRIGNKEGYAEGGEANKKKGLGDVLTGGGLGGLSAIPEFLAGGAFGGAALRAMQGKASGGRVARKDGGKTESKMEKHEDAHEDRKLVKDMIEKECRPAHRRGGKVKSGKGKTNINIIIGDTSKREPGMPPPPPAPPMRPPGMQMPQPGPPGPGGPPPMAPPPGGPPMGGPPMGAMPRKSGGRTYKQMDAGAGSGVGRLEKIGKSP